MKKNIFILAASAFLILGGLAFTTCDDDDPTPTPPPDDIGTKQILIKVVNETDQPISANVTITKNGTETTSIVVAGSDNYDITNNSSGTVFKFEATKDGYIESKDEIVILTYSDPAESFNSSVTLLVTKKGDPVTLSPTQDNNFDVPSTTGESVHVDVPAGAVDREVTLVATSIPTAGSRNDLAADAPDGRLSLQTIDLESDWSSDFLNGQKAIFTFPLTQDIINATVKNGIPLLFGSNSRGQWESYLVTVNEATLTGTVSIPHFSRWYLTTDVLVNIETTQTPFETLGTSICGEGIEVTFTKTNTAVPEFYQQIFGWTSIPDVSMPYSQSGLDGHYWIVRGSCVQKTARASRESIPPYTFYQNPVSFSSTAISCTHNGGGGQ